MKFFSKDGGLTKTDVNDLVALAQDEARGWYDLGILPPSSGNAGVVLCSERVSRYLARCPLSFSSFSSWFFFRSRVRELTPPATRSSPCIQVDFMPHYGETLKRAVAREVGWESSSSSEGLLPLSGLKIVVNPGSGAGCFFVDVLRDLGADVSGSIHTVPDGTFPVTFGVPNPEKKAMVDETMRACAACGADLGIMFDTE